MHTALPPSATNPDPAAWAVDRFGLPADRWDALANQAFWVVGGGTGYGRCIAHALAAAGARVFISGRRPHKLQETLSGARSLGIDTSRCHPIPVDITDDDSVATAVQAIGRHTDHLSGLVNCAALPEPPSSGTPLLDLASADWNRLIGTNLSGQWRTCKAAWPLLIRHGRWRVLFLSSEAGWAFTPGFGPYNVSKAALNSLAASFAAEARAAHPGADVQINVVDPGEALTEMNRGSPNSPYLVVGMVLALLSHPHGGPNGHFFHRDGRHLAFAYAKTYPRDLLAPETSITATQAA